MSNCFPPWNAIFELSIAQYVTVHQKLYLCKKGLKAQKDTHYSNEGKVAQ